MSNGSALEKNLVASVAGNKYKHDIHNLEYLVLVDLFLKKPRVSFFSLKGPLGQEFKNFKKRMIKNWPTVNKLKKQMKCNLPKERLEAFET